METDIQIKYLERLIQEWQKIVNLNLVKKNKRKQKCIVILCMNIILMLNLNSNNILKNKLLYTMTIKYRNFFFIIITILIIKSILIFSLYKHIFSL